MASLDISDFPEAFADEDRMHLRALQDVPTPLKLWAETLSRHDTTVLSADGMMDSFWIRSVRLVVKFWTAWEIWQRLLKLEMKHYESSKKFLNNLTLPHQGLLTNPPKSA